MEQTALVEQIFRKPKADEIPYINCRHNGPELTYAIFEKSWEGMKIMLDGSGNPKRVITHDHVVSIENGFCKIPDTPNNRARLERISKPQIRKEKTIRTNVVTGLEEEVFEDVEVPPKYEILEESLLHDKILDQLASRMESRKNEKPKQYIEEEKPFVPEAPVPANHVRRGRPPKNTGKSIKEEVVRPQGEVA